MNISLKYIIIKYIKVLELEKTEKENVGSLGNIWSLKLLSLG